MKHRSTFVFSVAVTVLIIAGAAGLASQWQQTMALRGDMEAARMEADELQRLKAANARLKAQQISEAELAALRADHAALPRLRAEIEALKKGQGPAPAASARPAGR